MIELMMGFNHHWLKLMMECISSVQYRVLLNGQPKGHIIPQRGLRQGDPLSPYLFIMCTEALIVNIKKAEREKLLTGNTARACPPISHLLFRMIVFSSVKQKARNVRLFSGYLRNTKWYQDSR